LLEDAESCFHLEVGKESASKGVMGFVRVVLADLFSLWGIARGEMHVGKVFLAVRVTLPSSLNCQCIK
jgi:hypothetical protein